MIGALKPLLIGIALVLIGKALERKGISPAGRLLGMPYDFRPPTLDRVRAAFWDPSNPSIVAPTAFGVGFGLNFGALARRLKLA